MTDKAIKLGCIARDKITKFEGVVSEITYWFNKCVRVDIKPTSLKEGALQETHCFDIEQVEWVGKGELVPIDKPLPDARLILGNEAKDKISGFQGIILAYSEYLSGFKTLHVQPRGIDTKDGTPLKGVTFEADHLEYVGPGINPEQIIKKEKATGGPMPNVSGGRHS